MKATCTIKPLNKCAWKLRRIGCGGYRVRLNFMLRPKSCVVVG